jgi:choline monooxygenase
MTETLPAEWYTDPAIHRRERAAIFARDWCLFGPEAEFSNPGDYRAAVINGWPVFVIRGHDGVLRGFHNVCRHRAAQILADGAGACTMLRCPYHGLVLRSRGAAQGGARFRRRCRFPQGRLRPVPAQGRDLERPGVLPYRP